MMPPHFFLVIGVQIGVGEQLFEARETGIHRVAAQVHDLRVRQGLEYQRQEQEVDRQLVDETRRIPRDSTRRLDIGLAELSDVDARRAFGELRGKTRRRGVARQPPYGVAELFQLARRMHLRMRGDDSFDERGTGARLAYNEYRRVAVMALPGRVHPLPREQVLESRIGLYFARLVIVDRAASSLRAVRERRKRRIPLLEILEFLAETVVDKRQRLGRILPGRHEPFHFIDVRTIRRLAQAGQYPVRVGVARLHGQDFPQRALGRLELADEHEAIGMIDPEHDVVGFLARSPVIPFERLLFLAEQCMHRAYQILHDGIAVLVLNRPGERLVGQRQLPAQGVLASEVGPGGAVIGLQFRHRTECAGGDAPLIHFDCNQPDEKMRLGQLRILLQHAPAALGRAFRLPGLQEREAAAQFVAADSVIWRGFHIVNILQRGGNVT